MKYRKKPVEIEAVQLKDDYTTVREILIFLGKYSGTPLNWFDEKHFDEYVESICREGLDINTLEGKIHASIGDYIIKGVNGEFYPCKPDIFEKTYELVES